jgi:hypothetical protein
LEARLGERLSAQVQAVTTPMRVVAAAATIETVPEPTPTPEPVALASSDEESAAIWPDESAESSFLAEARSRGESVTPPKPKEEMADDADTKPLPPLNELVDRIPAEVRDALEDLFRARFVKVKRVPKSAFKS